MKKLFYFIVILISAAVLTIGASILINKNPEIRADVEGVISKIEAIFTKSDPQPAEAVQGALYGPYDVIRAIDGDTLLLDVDGKETRVRLIGVNTPESISPDTSKNSEQGKTASNFTKALFETVKTVYLEYDVQREDDYGRTLAYVYLDSGKTMLQDELLKAGMARTMTIQPNSKYANHFYNLMVKAREEKVGFWAENFWSDSE